MPITQLAELVSGPSLAVALLAIALLVVGDRALGSARSLPLLHPPLLLMVVAICVLATLDMDVQRFNSGVSALEGLPAPFIVAGSLLELVPLAALVGISIYMLAKLVLWRSAEGA